MGHRTMATQCSHSSSNFLFWFLSCSILPLRRRRPLRWRIDKSAAFFRGSRMNGERMDAAFEFVRQRCVDHAVAFKPGLSAERLRYNIEAEVGLAARPMPGVSLVQMGFVFDVQALGRESRNELGRYDVLHTHRQAQSRTARLGNNKTLGVQPRRADLPAVKS